MEAQNVGVGEETKTVSEELIKSRVILREPVVMEMHAPPKTVRETREIQVRAGGGLKGRDDTRVKHGSSPRRAERACSVGEIVAQIGAQSRGGSGVGGPELVGTQG